MSPKTLPVLLAGAALLLASAAAVYDEERPERDLSKLTQADKAEIMQRHMAVMGPGEEHGLLSKYEGAWDQTTRMWMTQGADPITVKGTSNAEMVLGGRFLMIRGKGKFMGMPNESLTMMGFDRRSGEFTIQAYDSSGTYSVGARGPLGEDGKTAVMHGTDYDAIGEGTQVYDFVMHWIDDDTWKVEIIFHDAFHAPDGKPFKMVEITNERAGDRG